MKEIYIRKESEEKTHPTPPKGTPWEEVTWRLEKGSIIPIWERKAKKEWERNELQLILWKEGLRE